MLPRGDFVIVTVPETPETQGMFAAAQFASMKPSAFFINIGRGATVVLDDLVVALEGGRIAGAGLDVFQVEPLPVDYPLFALDNVIVTSHLAWYTEEADARLAAECMARTGELLAGETPRNLKNREALGLS